MKSLSTISFSFFTMVLTLLYNTFCWGFVFMKFWGWFITPVFTTLPLITLHQAIGISIVIGLFKVGTKSEAKPNKNDSAMITDIVFFLIDPWIVLLIGYLFFINLK